MELNSGIHYIVPLKKYARVSINSAATTCFTWGDIYYISLHLLLQQFQAGNIYPQSELVDLLFLDKLR